jgi:hypothetical protein
MVSVRQSPGFKRHPFSCLPSIPPSAVASSQTGGTLEPPWPIMPWGGREGGREGGFVVISMQGD